LPVQSLESTELQDYLASREASDGQPSERPLPIKERPVMLWIAVAVLILAGGMFWRRKLN